MDEDENTGRRGNATYAGGQKKIVWEESDIRSLYANVTNVTGTQEEIMLLFGESRTGHAGRKDVRVRLKERVILSPLVAKRLAIILNNSIYDYESRYGPLVPESPPSTGLDQTTSPGKKPPIYKTEKTAEKASLLFQLMKDLNLELGLERSFKIYEKTLLGNRFLLGINKESISQKPHEKILNICEQMDMPEDFFKTFKENLSDANYVHFGFEENERSCVYKAYLEFGAGFEEEIKKQLDKNDSFLLHLGFKWDAQDNTRQALSKYTRYPSLSVENILERLSNIFDSNKYIKPFEITKGILDIASRRISPDDILYLEVTEDNNPRRSFDINLYKANLQLMELYPLLSKLYRHYSIPSEEFHALYGQVETKEFGHISGGIDREGRDFLTIYFGMEGYFINRIQDYESKHVPLGVKSPPSAGRDLIMPPFNKSSFSKTEGTDEKAGLVIQLVDNLNIRYGFERSFKFLENTILANRFLLGFEKDTIRENTHDKILDICERINMPETFLETFQDNLWEANIVLFGFEQNEKTCLYKSYLEFGGRFEKVFKANPVEPCPFIIHLGFKWDASDNLRRAIARYTCFPSFTAKDMLERLSNVFYSHKYRSLSKITEGIVNLGASRIDPNEFLYFEMNEENNPRISFDINMYRANLRMEELYPFLLEIGRYYSIPDEQFRNLYEAIKTRIFGHLTGGIDREGRDFLTIYFAEKGSSR